MATPDERDWELINGYADGALSPVERERVARRLTTEPALAAALTEVQKVKAGLSLLAPRPVAAEPEVPARRPGRRALPALAAACVALVIGAAIGAAVIGGAGDANAPMTGEMAGDAASTLAQIHAGFSARAYALRRAEPVGTISTGSMGDLEAFDLAPSRLTLVDVRDMRANGRDLVAMHYRGPNGCRLTIAAALGDAIATGATEAGLTARWTSGRIGFHVIATGMDAARFAAIADYLRSESLHPAESAPQRLALASATETARPCV